MKTIQFIPVTSGVVGAVAPPIPAHKMLPNWYREQPASTTEHTRMEINGKANATIKKCMPVLDDMTAGYLFTTPCDIQFDRVDPHKYDVTWSLEIGGMPERGLEALGDPVITSHAFEQVSHLHIPEEFFQQVWKLTNYYRIRTPKGYSCLFRQPSWRDDLPFRVFSGIVDTDRHPVEVNFPFILRNSFDGILPAGTPFVQIIPFKRTKWQSVVLDEPNHDGAREFRASTKRMMHRYKDNWRSFKTWR